MNVSITEKSIILWRVMVFLLGLSFLNNHLSIQIILKARQKLVSNHYKLLIIKRHLVRRHYYKYKIAIGN